MIGCSHKDHVRGDMMIASTESNHLCGLDAHAVQKDEFSVCSDVIG